MRAVLNVPIVDNEIQWGYFWLFF